MFQCQAIQSRLTAVLCLIVSLFVFIPPARSADGPLSLEQLAVAQQCGNSADADILIMIDKTGSVSPSDLTLEKNAAKSLLGFFDTAIVKPRVGIGSFNVGDFNNARIEPGGALTDVYGHDNPNDTGLYEVINNIAGTGGFTDVGTALNVAQAELALHALTMSRYIIIISDGITNRPSVPVPSDCSTGTPGANANAAADAAELAGTTIFTIHFGEDDPCSAGTGSSFLQNQIATAPQYYYEGNTDLSGVFGQISQVIACDDQLSCTSDFCN